MDKDYRDEVRQGRVDMTDPHDGTSLTTEQSELLDRIYKDTEIDARYMVENEMPADLDDFMGGLQDLANELDVIYYHRAMEYLAEHDASLTESLGIAHDMGYTADNINSELLATLLLQQNAREDVAEFRDEIEELFFNA